ncbi:MAG: type II secretion system protein [Candidatus Cloacimonetes bacterium]|nr:type II secretion system protein [Candidatus Cloacimonadota bacterium]
MKTFHKKAFTLLETMMVAAIMIMVSGMIYTFHINLVRTYYRGSEILLDVQQAQTILEIMTKELRSASVLVKLEPDYLEFLRFYDADLKQENDPVRDLNRVQVRKITYRVRKDDDDFYNIERQEGNSNFTPLAGGLRSKVLVPTVFKGWKKTRKGYFVYDSNRSGPDRIPLIQITLELKKEKNPITLLKKVFLPVPYGNTPKL